jgi:hypothetical protein
MGPTLIHELLDGGVEFVLVGGTAAVLHGAPIVTHGVDIVHRQTAENVERLVKVLDAHHAMIREVAQHPTIWGASRRRECDTHPQVDVTCADLHSSTSATDPAPISVTSPARA